MNTNKRKPESKILEGSRHSISLKEPVTPSFRKKDSPQFCKTKELYKRSPNIIKGWNRGLLKYDGTKDQLSPVKQTVAVLRPKTKDVRMNGCAWILNMSEQFYYENILTLFSVKCDETIIRNILLKNIAPQNIEKILSSWSDIKILGSGSFGTVYKVYDKSVNEYLALKYLKKINDDAEFKKNIKQIILYLQERHYLMQAYESPFTIKFKYSFQLNGINGLFLVTECCLCDLNALLKIFKTDKSFSLTHLLCHHNNSRMIEDLHEGTNFGFNTLEIIEIYIFEIFCILDFLGKCKIVHRDIKPANIMIAMNGHLKLGDFGVVNNTRFIYSSLFRDVVVLKKLPRLVDSAYKRRYCGTKVYYEMEALFVELKDHHSASYDSLVNSRGFMKPNFDTSTYRMDFSTDIWAMGLVIIELLFLGQSIVLPDHMTSAMQLNYGFKMKETLLNMARMFYIKSVYKSYIVDGLKSFCIGKYKSIFELLLRILKPRSQRALEDTTEVVMKIYCREITARTIDINKIENLPLFQDEGMTSDLILFREMPSNYLSTLTQKLAQSSMQHTNSLNVKDWIDQLKQESANSRKMFAIEPGCSLISNQ